MGLVQLPRAFLSSMQFPRCLRLRLILETTFALQTSEETARAFADNYVEGFRNFLILAIFVLFAAVRLPEMWRSQKDKKTVGNALQFFVCSFAAIHPLHISYQENLKI